MENIDRMHRRADVLASGVAEQIKADMPTADDLTDFASLLKEAAGMKLEAEHRYDVLQNEIDREPGAVQ